MLAPKLSISLNHPTILRGLCQIISKSPRASLWTNKTEFLPTGKLAVLTFFLGTKTAFAPTRKLAVPTFCPGTKTAFAPTGKLAVPTFCLGTKTAIVPTGKLAVPTFCPGTKTAIVPTGKLAVLTFCLAQKDCFFSLDDWRYSHWQLPTSSSPAIDLPLRFRYI
jgi:hypothetical protein